MDPLLKIGLKILQKNNSPAFQRIQGIASEINSARDLYNSWNNWRQGA